MLTIYLKNRICCHGYDPITAVEVPTRIAHSTKAETAIWCYLKLCVKITPQYHGTRKP